MFAKGQDSVKAVVVSVSSTCASVDTSHSDAWHTVRMMAALLVLDNFNASGFRGEMPLASLPEAVHSSELIPVSSLGRSTISSYVLWRLAGRIRFKTVPPRARRGSRSPLGPDDPLPPVAQRQKAPAADGGTTACDRVRPRGDASLFHHGQSPHQARDF